MANGSDGQIVPASTGLFARLFSVDNLTKKASLNALAAVADYGTRLVVGFFVNPLLVTGLGSYGFGAWQMLQRVVAYVGPASGRTTQALKTTIANRQGSLDFEEKRRLVGSAVVVWLVFLPLLILLGLALGWWAPLWLKAPPVLAWTARIAAAVMVLDAILTSLVDLPRSVIEGENLAYKRVGLSAFLVLVGGGLVALALWLDTGLVGVACATLVGTVLTGIFFYRLARVFVPWFGVARPLPGEARRFAGLSGWFLAWSFIMKAMRGADVVVLGLAGTVEVVSVYALTRYLPETVINLVSILVFAMTPGLGRIIGLGEIERARRIRAEVMALTWLVFSVSAVTILAWNRSFVALWVGAEFDAGPISTALIVLLAGQFVLIRNDASIIDLTLDLRTKVLMGFVSVLVSLGLAAWFVRQFHWGIPGLCVGYVAGRALLSFSYPWIVGRHLGIPVHVQALGCARPVLTTAAFFAIGLMLDRAFEPRTWVVLALVAALTTGGALLVGFFVGLPRGLRRDLLRRARLVT